MAIVYVHRREIDNTPFYVGIGNSLKRAYNFNNSQRNDYWYRTYKKYGVIVEIVENDVSFEQAKELEVFLIDLIGLSNLTNMTLGGEGMLGFVFSEESKKKMSASGKNRITTDETKKRISAAGLGRKHSVKSKELIAKAHRKKVIKMDADYNELDEYDSIYEASILNSSNGYSHIGCVANGLREFSLGYRWKFKKSNYD